MLDFTGERAIEGKVEQRIWDDHLARYRFAAGYLAQRSVLDLACGTGYGSRLMAEEGAAASVLAIDTSPEAAAYAAVHYEHPRVKFAVGDATDLPLPTSSVEAVVSFETIEHVPDYRRYLSEVRRVLTNNGIYIVSTPNATFTSPNRRSFASSYHVFELDQRGFHALLDEHFGSVEMWGQRFLPRFLLYWPIRKVAGLVRRSLYLEADGSPEIRKPTGMEQSRYTIAVCAR